MADSLYFVYGLCLRSVIPLGHSQLFKPQSVDVDVVYGDVPTVLPAAAKSRPRFDASDKKTLLRIPEVGRFLIEAGRSITICPEPDATEEMLRVYLLGSACGALLMQRGLLPLHASTITDGKSAILICGRSGNGKSTTSAAMIQQGFRWLSDDVSPVGMHEGQVTVWPAYPRMKLWAEAMENLQLAFPSADKPRQLVTGIEKYSCSFDTEFHPQPMPVSAIVWLDKGSMDSTAMEQQSGGRAFEVVRRNTYRKAYLTDFSRSVQWTIAAELLKQADVYRLIRPSHGQSVQAVVKLLSNLFHSARAAA